MSSRSGFPSAKEDRPWPRWSFGGRLFVVILVVLLLLGFGLERLAPLLVAALQIAILLCSLPFARSLRAVQPAFRSAGVIDESSSRGLPMRLENGGRLPLAGVELWLRGDGLQGRGASMFLGARSSQEIEVQVRALRRGEVREVTCFLESRAPFGLLIHRRTCVIPADFLLLPRPRPVREDLVPGLLGRAAMAPPEPISVGPGDGEFWALREMRPGEVERRVHPRLSARRGRKVRAVYRGVEQSRVHLLLDPRLPKDLVGRIDFEDAIRAIAGLARALQVRGVPFQLWERTAEGFVVRTRPHDDFGRVLAALARVIVHRSPDAPGTPGSLCEPAAEGRWLLVHGGLVRPESIPSDWSVLQVGSEELEALLDRGPKQHAR